MKRSSMLMWVLLLPTFAFLSVAFLFPMVAFLSVANAQNPVITNPSGVISFNNSGTVASTGVFQSIWAANAQRKSCTIQNNSGRTMYVYFGAIAGATTGKSVVVVSGQYVGCFVGQSVLQDQISITGTTGDAFFAAQQ